ncbi:PaeR7I family type II restriction endonuclease [Ralstonia pseudosolanacearum]
MQLASKNFRGKSPNVPIFDKFKGIKRYDLLCQKLVQEQL